MQMINRINALAALALAFAQVAAGAQLHPASGSASSDGGKNQLGVSFDLGKTYSEAGFFKVSYTGQALRNYNVYIFAGSRKDNTTLFGTVDGYDCSSTSEPKDDVRFFRIEKGANRGYVKFFDAAKAENIVVSEATVAEALSHGDAVWDEVNKDDLLSSVLGTYPLPTDPFAKLPKFKAALVNGTACRVHLLGDSITQDTNASLFRELVKRAYPNSNLTFTMHAEGSTGCPVYATKYDTAVAAYNPDVLVICGIDNFRGNGFESVDKAATALKTVIETAQAAGIEVLYVSPLKSYDSRGITDMNTLTEVTKSADLNNGEANNIWYAARAAAAWDRAGDIWAQKAYFPTERNAVLDAANVQCWDVFPQVQEFVCQSGRPYGWFNRDPAHNNERGKELIARLLLEYVKKAGRVQ